MKSSQLLELDYFNGLSVTELNYISPYFSFQTFKSGQKIFNQGTAADYLYLICEGSVEIIFKPEDGPPMKITTINRGGIFGWSAVIGNQLYTSGAQSCEDCKILRLRGTDLHIIVREYPHLGSQLLEQLESEFSDRLRNRHFKFDDILDQSDIFKNVAKEN